MKKTKDHQLVDLPVIVTPDDHYFIKPNGINKISHYIGGAEGNPIPVNPPSVSGDTNIIFYEEPTGLINGVNVTFTTQYNFVPSKVKVYLNGLLQKIVTDYLTMGNNTISLTVSPETGEHILITYLKL